MKVKKVSYFEVSYKEVEKFVRQNYPKIKDYSFVATQECGNDSKHTFSPASSDISEEEWEEITSGYNKNYSNYEIFYGLCRDGYIEEGDYIVDVCW